MADKLHSGTQARITVIDYRPVYQNTGDLEAGTNAITATSEASGVGNADYSAALTLAKPDDARLEIKRLASRLAVTIDSFDVLPVYTAGSTWTCRTRITNCLMKSGPAPRPNLMQWTAIPEL